MTIVCGRVHGFCAHIFPLQSTMRYEQNVFFSGTQPTTLWIVVRSHIANLWTLAHFVIFFFFLIKQKWICFHQCHAATAAAKQQRERKKPSVEGRNEVQFSVFGGRSPFANWQNQIQQQQKKNAMKCNNFLRPSSVSEFRAETKMSRSCHSSQSHLFYPDPDELNS